MSVFSSQDKTAVALEVHHPAPTVDSCLKVDLLVSYPALAQKWLHSIRRIGGLFMLEQRAVGGVEGEKHCSVA